VLGAGSIIPTQRRFSSGILIESDAFGRILLDIGPGTIEKLRRIGIDPREIKAVLISHLHIDHVLDLLALLKIRTFPPRRILRIYGPSGILDWLDLMTTDRRLFGYLSDLRCKDIIRVHECWEDSRELEGGLRIRTTPVNHFRSVAYRLDLPNGVSITYSGDTAPDPKLVELGRGSTILIHECSFPADKLAGKHTSDLDLVEIARGIQPKILIAIHLYPEMEEKVDELISRLRSAFPGEVHIPEDMEVIEV